MRVIEPASGSGAGYDAVAFTVISQAVNTASVEQAWAMADDRRVVAELLRNIAQLDVGAKTLTDLAASASDMATVAASADAMNSLLLSPAARSTFLGSATAMGAILDNQTARHEIWKSDNFLSELAANNTAHDLARAEGVLISKTQNGTSATDLTSGVTGGNLDGAKKYLFLGVSWSITFDTTIALATRRSGSSAPVSGDWLGTQGSGAEATAAFDIAAPIEGPTITATAGAGSANTLYFRVLDCTPPA